MVAKSPPLLGQREEGSLRLPGGPCGHVSEVSEVSTSKGQGSWGLAGLHLGALPRKSGSRIRAKRPAGRKGGGTLMHKCVWQGHFWVGRKEPTREKHRDAKEEKGPRTEDCCPTTRVSPAKEKTLR